MPTQKPKDRPVPPQHDGTLENERLLRQYAYDMAQADYDSTHHVWLTPDYEPAWEDVIPQSFNPSSGHYTTNYNNGLAETLESLGAYRYIRIAFPQSPRIGYDRHPGWQPRLYQEIVQRRHGVGAALLVLKTSGWSRYSRNGLSGALKMAMLEYKKILGDAIKDYASPDERIFNFLLPYIIDWCQVSFFLDPLDWLLAIPSIVANPAAAPLPIVTAAETVEQFGLPRKLEQQRLKEDAKLKARAAKRMSPESLRISRLMVAEAKRQKKLGFTPVTDVLALTDTPNQVVRRYDPESED